jgi:hypothetical protein
MIIPQDTFNKIITIVTLTFMMVMYAWSFATGRHLDIVAIAGFLVPTVLHGSHLLYNIKTNGGSNGKGTP